VIDVDCRGGDGGGDQYAAACLRQQGRRDGRGDQRVL
jgi:hypothetical protein